MAPAGAEGQPQLPHPVAEVIGAVDCSDTEGLVDSVPPEPPAPFKEWDPHVTFLMLLRLDPGAELPLQAVDPVPLRERPPILIMAKNGQDLPFQLLDFDGRKYYGAVWGFAFVFIVLQLGTIVLRGESFFGMLTGSVVESIREKQGAVVYAHLFGGCALWILAFAQVALRRLRRQPWAWVHRLGGRLFFAVWFLVSGPSALFLSLFCSVGPRNSHVAMTMFAIISLDTTVLAYYYFCRALQLARRRARGGESLALHGRAVRWGLLLTMTILWQRPMQFVTIVIRKALVLVAAAVPATWLLSHYILDSLLASALDHHVILSWTTCSYGLILMAMLDGPHSGIMASAVCLTKEDFVEFFGEKPPSLVQIWAWRLRYAIYVALRALATRGWTGDALAPL